MDPTQQVRDVTVETRYQHQLLAVILDVMEVGHVEVVVSCLRIQVSHVDVSKPLQSSNTIFFQFVNKYVMVNCIEGFGKIH